jgi:hypothetical protein
MEEMVAHLIAIIAVCPTTVLEDLAAPQLTVAPMEVTLGTTTATKGVRPSVVMEEMAGKQFLIALMEETEEMEVQVTDFAA